MNLQDMHDKKGNHNFIMTKRKLKSFLAIIIVSGYASLPRQDMYWQTRDDTNWKDNKFVNVRSTFAGKEPVQKVKRYSQKAKKIIDIPQPKVVHVYNRYMGGVDRLDQNLRRT